MNYYRVEGDNIFKFNVNVNRKRLQDIRKELIENSSTIKHYSYDSDKGPVIDSKFIKNYSCEFLGYKDNHDLDGNGKTMYHYEYDEYSYPSLVHTIDEILNGSYSGLKDLDEYKEQSIEDEELSLVREEQEIIDTLDSKNANLKERLDELNKIQIKLKALQNSKRRIPESTYYSDIVSCLNMSYDSKISLGDFENFSKFMSSMGLETMRDIVQKYKQEQFKTK